MTAGRRLAGGPHPLRAVAFGLHLAALFLTALTPASLRAHDPPAIAIESDLTEASLKTNILVKEEIYRHWFPDQEPTLINEMSEEELDAVMGEVQAFLAEFAEVEIDRVPVQPVVDFVEFQEGYVQNDFLNYLGIDVIHGVKGKPRQMSFQWRRFDTADEGWSLLEVEAILTHDGEYFVMLFTPEEPQNIWHAPTPDLRPRKPWVPTPPPTVAVPVVSLGLLGSLLLTLPLLFWRRARRTLKWGAFLGTCILAAVLQGIGVREMIPPWAARADLPDLEEARYLFESLHRNIYRAFDYDQESEIYDALAQSVDGELLDGIYNEVYQSLVLEEEGGAVCKVRGVKLLESEVILPEASDVPTFQVRCQWRVTGQVEHWGHSHWRTNQYRALYGLRGDGEKWRIHDVQVEDQQRVTGDSGNVPSF